MAREQPKRKVSLAAVLGCSALLGLLVCCILLLSQSFQMQEVQRELVKLREQIESNRRPLQAASREEHTSQPCMVTCSPPPLGDEDTFLGKTTFRARRQSGKDGRGPSGRRRSVVHLVPLSTQTNEDLDLTEIEWKIGIKQGGAFEVNRTTLTIKDSGLYYVYSQVLYRDMTFVMGHVIMKRTVGDQTSNEVTLLKCIQSMPSTKEQAFNTCYSAGMYFLEKGSVLQLSVPRFNAGIALEDHSTFMGLIKL
ncbi:tumor necrosis factor ligand superfamily member 13 isoform X1 [Polypterus senegalus]|uniref:tumor necrosis factor ligand superfamily member 13 isoform X1 n=1 Tax=Polypterus senegalus TaxID=55291 RepID=UPI001963CEEF|nr:tumor necrosis factor ligand superfamily member 13 isoform X1 [Polypterus senegalus]